MPRWTEEDFDEIVRSHYKVVEPSSLEEYKPTNYDRIMAMSEEELAEFLNVLFVEGQIEALHEQYPDSVFNQKESSLKWLQAEAEG